MDPRPTCAHVSFASGVEDPELKSMVFWDWYDGPEAGLMICDKCETEFYFYMVDWSHDQNTRVFALHSVHPGAVARLAKLSGEEPRRPLWMPTKLRFPLESDRHWIDQIDSIVVGELDVPTHVLVWDYLKLIPLQIAEVFPDERKFVSRLLESNEWASPFDWFSKLGIAR